MKGFKKSFHEKYYGISNPKPESSTSATSSAETEPQRLATYADMQKLIAKCDAAIAASKAEEKAKEAAASPSDKSETRSQSPQRLATPEDIKALLDRCNAAEDAPDNEAGDAERAAALAAYAKAMTAVKAKQQYTTLEDLDLAEEIRKDEVLGKMFIFKKGKK
jgi:hypothetical protein